VLEPGSLRIIDVTEAYLKATATRESDIVGKLLFEVFPDNPEDVEADGVKILAKSLQRVQLLKTTDIMGVQRYPIRIANGQYEERFWSPVNIPILNDAGEIEFIMHRAEDITTIVKKVTGQATVGELNSNISTEVLDIILRSQELQLVLSKLKEYEARMRTAERLLKLGAWEFNVKTGKLSWSEQVFDIYDIPVGESARDLAGYFALVHPDDRDASLAVYAEFEEKKASQIEFEHRVIGRDGEVRYIKGAGERHALADGEIIVGYVQNITTLVRTRRQLSQAEHMLRLAGEKARLGGWRVELSSGSTIWTPETAVIHDMPATYSPASVEEAIQYYVPESRAVIEKAFDACARLGVEFDVICQLQTPLGRHPWVRAIGIAERDEQGKIVAVQGAFQDITALHEAQTKAEEAERQRLNILESINDAFFAIDTEWKFTYLNEQCNTLLERSKGELLGRNIWSEFPHAVGTVFQRQYENAMNNQETSRFQSFYPPLEKWFDVSAYPIPDGVAVYFRDVTRERTRQEQLRLVEAALSRQNDMVMITEAGSLEGPDGPKIVYVNDAFDRLTGYAKDEAIGKTPRFLQGIGSDRQVLSRMRNALTKFEPIRSEVLNYTKSGEPYWVELDITPLFDESGHCTHFVAVERDITQRKHNEDDLRQAQERYQLIAKATNDVIWDWDFSSNKVWWNETVSSVYGYALTEMEPGPESWSRRIHPEDLERVLESIHQVIDGEGELWTGEYRFLRGDGQYAHVSDRGYVFRNEAGSATRMVGSMVDITERLEMERRLRESQKLEAVGHLTGGVAHDFNNLLTVIMGNAEMLAELGTDPNLRAMADMTLAAAQRGAELTSRLLAFARRQPLNPQATDINQLVQAMRALIRPTLPEDIEFELVPDPDLGIAEVDAGELDTALLNLVVNARDAMPNGGKLTIETANAVLDSHYTSHHPEVVPGEYVMIAVSDTGSGMDAQTASRAFEPFFTTKAVGKGSGLGLSMVFGFTKQSGGHLKIYSEPGEGTSVKLYFPRVRGAQPAGSMPLGELTPEGGTEHILIAEDDDLVLQHLERQLRSLGYRVTAVTSGPEALKALKVHSDVDLLLTDIIMPGGMNGRELADQVRAIYPSLKILFSSGYTENAIVHHGRLDPGVNLLSKPYTRLELATRVRLALTKTSRPS